MEITTVQQNLKKIYYNNLISQMKKKKMDISYLSTLLQSIDNNVNESETKTIINTETDIKSDDEYLYRKPWNKLNNIHKMIKLKEFVNNLPINNNSDKIELKNKLTKMVKSKQLTKKTSVNYDDVNCRIVSIPCLQVKNNKYVIV